MQEEDKPRSCTLCKSRSHTVTVRSGWRSAHALAQRHYGMRARRAAAYGIILGVDLDSSFGSTEGHIWRRAEPRVLQIPAEEQKSEGGFGDSNTQVEEYGGGKKKQTVWTHPHGSDHSE